MAGKKRFKKLTDTEAENLIKKAFSEKPKINLPPDFNSKVWEKIGEREPSWLDNIFAASFLKPALGFALLLVVALIVFKPAGLQPEKKADEIMASKPAMNVKRAPNGNSRPSQVEVKEYPALRAGNTAGNEPVMAEVPVKPEEMQAEVKKETIANVTGANTAMPVMPSVPGAAVSAAGVTDKPGITLNRPPAAPELEIKGNIIKPLNNEEMVIKYRLDSAGEVLITIYDRTSRPVLKVTEKQPEAGVYSFSWKGRDSSGRLLEDGIYIVTIKTPLTEKRIKAAIIK